MKNLSRLRQHKRFILETFNYELSHSLHEGEKGLKKSIHGLSRDCSDEELDIAIIDFFEVSSLIPSAALVLEKKEQLNIGICPECAEYPIGKDFNWPYNYEWNSGAVLYLCKACFDKGAQEETEYHNKRNQKGCYIATVCYGGENTYEVAMLKWYRDNILVKRFIGKNLINLYYSVSPYLAAHLSKRKALNSIIRKLALDPIVRSIETIKSKK